MKLYLMQHALAYSAAEDAERPLTAEGISQAKAAAQGVKRLGLGFDLIVTSPNRRAQQTAALVAEKVRYPYSDIVTSDAALPDRPPRELFELLRREPDASRVLVVGHQPQLARLAGELLGGGVLLIGNAGLTGFDLDGDAASLVFHFGPGQLALFA